MWEIRGCFHETDMDDDDDDDDDGFENLNRDFEKKKVENASARSELPAGPRVSPIDLQ